MGYVHTPAHMSAGLARKAGGVWPPPRSLIIRRANVYQSRRVDTLNPMPGSSLGWVEAIGPAIQALTSAGATVYSVVEARKDKKDAAAAERKARSIAAAEQAAAALQTQQAQEAVQQQQRSSGISQHLPIIVGIGSAVVALIVALKRR